MKVQKLSRTALLLALMIVFQSLRLYLPMPVSLSVFLIGSLVNACLLLAAEDGWKAVLTLSLVAPVVAFLQQALPLPIFILPIAAANAAYAGGYLALAGKQQLAAVLSATAAKLGIVYVTVTAIIQYMDISGAMAAALTMMLGWPQGVTGIGGGIIFLAVQKRLSKSFRG